MLQKQPLAINFTKGLDTKSDEYQVPLDSFLTLTNSVFSVTGRLTKRNGYPIITTLPDTNETVLTTLNDNLIATGSSLFTFSQDTNEWIEQGKVQPIQLDTMSLVRNSTSQQSPDIAVNTNGLTCLVYMDDGDSYYHVIDSINGQQVVERTQLPTTAINPRVFILGAYFIITFVATVAATPTLQYIALTLTDPSDASSATNISSDVNSLQAGYDGEVANNRLYIAWGASANTVKITSMTRSLGIATPASISGITADIMTLAINMTTQRVFIAYWETSGNDGYAACFTYNLLQVMAATQIINNIEIHEMTSITQGTHYNVYYETVNEYSYSTALTDYVSSLYVTLPISGTGAGTVSSPVVVMRSVGLASKPFYVEAQDLVYFMVAYGDPDQSDPIDNSNQPTYFLIDATGYVYMRLAYSNGGGYAESNMLPSIRLVDNTYYYPYQMTDFLTTVNKGTDLPDGTPVNAIYTQTGINMAKFQLNNGKQYSSEIATALHLTGGQLWEFDGVKPVEHGFHVWPENILVSATQTVGDMEPETYFYSFTYEWTDNAGNLHRSAPSIPYQFIIEDPPTNFTANVTNTDATLTSVSSFTGLQVGQVLSGTGIPGGTYILSLSPGTNEIEMSANASATNSGVTISPTAVSSVEINVPTLRITLKDQPNPVRIVGYRWSTNQQIYYQFTSVTSPVVNDLAVDSVEISDDNSDAAILGQTLLYTTGGVIENIAAPASIDSCLFDNRLWVIDAEDQNLLWHSKQVIQNVPVEMSDLLTVYVAPTTGTQGSTGPMRCIASMDDKLIIFKANALYYINGAGPDNTGANSTYSQPTYITGVAGSSNPNSIVLIPVGLMFQSNKGIWLLGRDLSTKYIGSPVERYNDLEVLSAEAIPQSTQVRFILEGGVTLMYDYFYDQWATHTNIQAISGVIYQNLHTYLNSYGQVYQEAPGTFKDGSEPVLMGLTTAWINIAGVQGFERFYYANLLGTYHTPFKLNMQFAYNYNPSASHNVIVTPVGNIGVPYGDESVYGGGPNYGGSEGNVFSARVFPQTQKCQSFQVTIQEIYDPSYSIEAGEGLSLSGLLLTVGMKRGSRTQKAARSFG